MMKELNKIEFEKALTGIESPSMIKYFLKEYIAFETEDGKLLTIKKNPTIDKTIYYDDELEPPVVNFQTFKRYNERNKNEYSLIDDFSEDERPYFIDNYCTDKLRVAVMQGDGFYSYYEENLEDCKRRGIFQRFMTDDEIKQYNQIMTDLRTKYDERLEKYFKRYGDHITTYGYWANR